MAPGSARLAGCARPGSRPTIAMCRQGGLKRTNKTHQMKRTLQYSTQLLLMSLLAIASMSAMAAKPQPSRLTQHWSVYNSDSSATIDHSALAALLDKYVIVRDAAPNLFQYQKVTA